MLQSIQHEICILLYLIIVNSKTYLSFKFHFDIFTKETK